MRRQGPLGLCEGHPCCCCAPAGSGGVLCDDMGLGKTVQAGGIALLACRTRRFDHTMHKSRPCCCRHCKRLQQHCIRFRARHGRNGAAPANTQHSRFYQAQMMNPCLIQPQRNCASVCVLRRSPSLRLCWASKAPHRTACPAALPPTGDTGSSSG